MHSSPSTGSLDRVVTRRPLKSVTYTQDELAVIAKLKENIKSALSRNPDIAELRQGGTFLLAALDTGDPEALDEAQQFLEGFRDRCLAQCSATQDRQLVPLAMEKPLEGGVYDVQNLTQMLQITTDLIEGTRSLYTAGVLHKHITPQAAAWRYNDNHEFEVFLIDHDYEMYRERNPRRPDDADKLRPLKSVTYSKEQLAIIANLKENVKSVLSRSPDNAELQVTGTFLQAALESGDPEALTEARQFLEGVRDRCLAQIHGSRQLVPLVLEKPLGGGLDDIKESSEAIQIAINVIDGMKSMEMAGVLHSHFTPQAAAWRRKDNDDLEVFLINHDYEMFRERNPRRPDDEENQQ
ncbi:hypothetical protein FRC05_002732 [Tulasnella sp. 425]|nr:hypothetical protein FRC05_002732 [Tulasnella sp. 425]